MKIKIFIFISTLAYLFISTLTDAQAPQGIPYQAVVRDASGNLVVNQGVNLQFTIRDNFALQIFYKETHIVYTNELGLLTANIGQGNPVVNTFFDIDWSNGLKFLNVQIDITGGSNFVDMGTTTILSVPYALYAGASKGDIAPGNNIGNTLRWDGTTWVNDSALYNDGISIGIGTNAPDAKLQINGSGENVSAHITSLITGTGRFHGLYIGLNGNSPYINNQESSDLTFGTSGITRMRIAPDGNVGIDATTPEFKLTIDNDGGILAKGTVGSGADLTNGGAGTRMIWYPKKAAFRVGFVDSTQWDDSNIGAYSTALGYNAQATSLLSVAIGSEVTATAFGTTAIGVNTTASGLTSMALGNNASTNFQFGAFVIGDNSTHSIVNAQTNNSFTTRFAGGYSFYSDSTSALNKGMFFKNGKLSVSKLNLNDGSQGTGKILISDSLGNATWVGSSPVHYIGENYGGGIVFYIWDNGLHGLIAGTRDCLLSDVQSPVYPLAFVTWDGNDGDDVRGAFRIGILGGLYNTQLINSKSTFYVLNSPIVSAAFLVTQYTEGNFSDWYLPNWYELYFLYQQKNVVGGFQNGPYWSSSESLPTTIGGNGTIQSTVSIASEAEATDFTTGLQFSKQKDEDAHVRAIRTF